MPKFVSVSYGVGGEITTVGNLNVAHLLDFFTSLRGTKYDMLRFADAELSPDDMGIISALIPAGLKTLEMVNLGISPPVMKILAKSLIRSHFQNLNLSDNPLGDSCAWHLLDFIGKNRDLKSLNISRCGLTSSAVFSLMTALAGKELDIIDLSGNIIGPHGTEYIVQFLGCDPVLTELRLNDCSLSAGDVEYLVDAALKCVRCKGISLTGNGVIARRDLPERIKVDMLPRMD